MTKEEKKDKINNIINEREDIITEKIQRNHRIRNTKIHQRLLSSFMHQQIRKPGKNG